MISWKQISTTPSTSPSIIGKMRNLQYAFQKLLNANGTKRAFEAECKHSILEPTEFRDHLLNGLGTGARFMAPRLVDI